MRIVKYKKEIEIMPGITFLLVPEEELEINSELVEKILKVIIDEGCQYQIRSTHSVVLAARGYKSNIEG